MVRGNQLLSIVVQLGDGGLLGLQTLTDEVLLGETDVLSTLWIMFYLLVSVRPLSYLILPLAGGVVQVGVAPVVVDSLLGLLVHPVQLIGAALHVVPQAQQVALAGAGIGLTEGKTDNRFSNMRI